MDDDNAFASGGSKMAVHIQRYLLLAAMVLLLTLAAGAPLGSDRSVHADGDDEPDAPILGAVRLGIAAKRCPGGRRVQVVGCYHITAQCSISRHQRLRHLCSNGNEIHLRPRRHSGIRGQSFESWAAPRPCPPGTTSRRARQPAPACLFTGSTAKKPREPMTNSSAAGGSPITPEEPTAE